MDDWKPLATLARAVDVPEASARRYAGLFPAFIVSRRAGKATLYAPEAGGVLRLVSDLFGQGARRAEVEEALRRRFTPVVDVVASRHHDATAGPVDALPAILSSLTPALAERYVAAQERQADMMARAVAALESLAARLSAPDRPQEARQNKRRPVAYPEAVAPVLAHAGASRAEIVEEVRQLHAAGLGARAVATAMRREGWPTLSGRGEWASGIVRRVLAGQVKP